jgi:hypothetical protein
LKHTAAFVSEKRTDAMFVAVEVLTESAEPSAVTVPLLIDNA